MNVSFLYFGKIPQLNGAAVFFNSLIEKKESFERNLGMNVHFFYQRTSPALILAANNLQKKRITLKSFLNQFIPKTLIGSILHFDIFLQRNAKKVIKQYLQNRKNVEKEILVFNDIFVGTECLKHKDINLSKSILILHNDGNPLQMIEESFPKIKKYKTLRRSVNNLINSVSRIVLLSEKAKENFVKSFPESKQKAVVINNGVELKESESQNPFEIPHDRLFGISVGTVSCRKGHDLLIKAMNSLPEEKKEKITVFCLGNISDDVDLSVCPKNLIFLKGVEHDSLSVYLKNTDFFLMCSRDEGVPLSILEAMQFGLPIFSTKVGGIPDIIDSNGVLFKPTAENIKDIILEILDGKHNLKDMATESLRLYNEKYSLDAMINKYITVIKDVENEQ